MPPSGSSIDEPVVVEAAPPGASATDGLAQKPLGKLAGKRLTLRLGALEGKVILLR